MPSVRRRHRAAPPPRIVLLVSEFHAELAEALIRGARGVLHRAGVPASHLSLLRVPGAFELPVVAARVVRSRPRPDAVLALGALIRGETPQYDIIGHAVADGLAHVSVTSGIPVAFGVIVATTLAQAKARAGGSMGNRGADAARAALAVLRLLETI